MKDGSGSVNILEARGGSLNVFQHQNLKENIFARHERSGQRTLHVLIKEGSSRCQNDTLVDLILEESEENESTAFANISEAAIVSEEEVDCSPFSNACSGTDGRDDFPCCGADGCKCLFHSESLCLDEQCGLPGGLCCSLEEGGGGFAYDVCTRDCLGLKGQCKDQPFATAGDANDGEFYLSNVLEIEQICGEEIDGDLSSSRRSQLEFLLLSYANNVLGVAGCGDSSFTSVTVTEFEQGSSCSGGFGGREGSATIHFNAAGICSEDGTCPDRYPLDTSPTLQRLLTESTPSIFDRYDRRLLEGDGLFVHFLNHNTDEWANITHALMTNFTSHNCTGCSDNAGAGGKTNACCGADGCPCVHVSDSLCEHTSCVIDGSGACCMNNFANCSANSYCKSPLFAASAAYEVPSTPGPSSKPSGAPSRMPSTFPSLLPSTVPSSDPSEGPSIEPTERPSRKPSQHPSSGPSAKPLHHPSSASERPSSSPTSFPSSDPSDLPTVVPSEKPTLEPSAMPSSASPSHDPTHMPSERPTTEGETPNPTNGPTFSPTEAPSEFSSSAPSVHPTKRPTAPPSELPSEVPSFFPSDMPSGSPSAAPTPVSFSLCHFICFSIC